MGRRRVRLAGIALAIFSSRVIRYVLESSHEGAQAVCRRLRSGWVEAMANDEISRLQERNHELLDLLADAVDMLINPGGEAFLSVSDPMRTTGSMRGRLVFKMRTCPHAWLRRALSDTRHLISERFDASD
jgi:hypothetical protein